MSALPPITDVAQRSQVSIWLSVYREPLNCLAEQNAAIAAAEESERLAKQAIRDMV